MEGIGAKEVIGFGLGLVSFVLAAMWWMARLIVSQQAKLLDAQFAAQSAQWRLQAEAQAMRIAEVERRLGQETDATRQLKQELHQLRIDLPERYLLRDDFIRFSGVIGEKMDRLHDKIDALMRGDYARRND